MENLRNAFLIGLMAISFVLYMKWLEFSNQAAEQPAPVTENQSVPSLPSETSQTGLPEAPSLNEGSPAAIAANNLAGSAPSLGTLITVETDLVSATINTLGGTIERLELKPRGSVYRNPRSGFCPA